MARLSRIVLPGIPHHTTQRGNRRERTFFEDGDYALHLGITGNCAPVAVIGRDLYLTASATGMKGGQTALERLKLMEKILRNW